MIRTPEPMAMHYGNLPLLTMRLGDFTIEGYSRAGVQTLFHIPELKLLLDHGAHAFDVANADTLALTHGHPDHLAGAFSYVAARRLLGMAPPRIIVPGHLLSDIETILAAWRRITGDPLECNLQPVRAGGVVPLHKPFQLRCFASQHVIPTIGYLVEERRRKLREEFIGLEAQQIADLRRKGTDVSQTELVPRLAFAGDTTIGTLDDHPMLLTAEILLQEISFLDASVSPENAREHGHTHLEDIVARAHAFQNRWLIGTHFSCRWDKPKILSLLGQHLPSRLAERFIAWL